MKTYVLLLLMFPIFNLSAQSYCTSGQYSEVGYFNPDEITIRTNVEYGRAETFQGITIPLRMDIYMASTDVDTTIHRPLIVLIHGGGFLNGKKNNYATTASLLAQAGYVVSSIDYRLGWDNGTSPCTGSLPSLLAAEYRAMQDAHAAVRYLIENQHLYHIDTGAIFLGGSSAGSTTALQLAYYSPAEASTLSSTLGGLNESGNAFRHTFRVRGVLNECGGIGDTSFIKSDTPIPMIAFHGSADRIVPIDTGRILDCYTPSRYHFIAGSRAIYHTLRNLGVCTELNVYPGGPHCAYSNDTLIAKRTACFFKGILCHDCASLDQEGEVPASCAMVAKDYLIQQDRGVKLYPNPASERLTILLIGETETVAKYSILSMSGRKQMQGILPEKQSTIDVSGLAQGMYCLTIDMPGKTITTKLIKL